MANPLLQSLRKKNKKGLFDRTQTMVMYDTGIPTLDFKNGYAVEVRNKEDELVDTYINKGIAGGSFVTVIGKAGVAKTTWCMQMASTIVKPFASGMVLHYDLEQALNYTRIKNVTGMSTRELDDKYILKQEKSYIEDIFDAIVEVAEAKRENPSDYMYDTGLKDEFNEPVKAYVPTVVIIDSIPTLSIRDNKKAEEMEGQTYTGRVARAIAQFYRKLMPIIKEVNVTIVAINHINAKIEINPMAKTQPQLMYLKMDESLPGGNSPVYYANNLFKFVKEGSVLTKEEDGVDGFKVRVSILKSRTNKANQSVPMIYNQLTGFDPVLSMQAYMEEMGLLDGRNPYKKFKGNDEVKFNGKKIVQEFAERPEVRDIMMKTLIPFLEKGVSVVEDSDKQAQDNASLLAEVFEVE